MKLNLLSKLSIINVEKLRLRAYIGFMDWEKKKLQDIVISFSFKYDVCLAAKNDDVKDAVDYKSITKSVIKFADNKHFNLIEHLAEKVYDLIQKSNPKIQNINVKIEKPNALRFSDNVLVEISGADRYNTAVITLGSNINPEKNFKKAIKYLSNLGNVVKRTEFIKTKALKFEEQDDFLNGAVLLLTKFNLYELHLKLKQIEVVLGRVKSENKNAPRKIDLDITTYNGFLIDDEIDELPFITDFVKFLQPDMEL